MIKLPYNGKLCTIKELSELSGIATATLRDRLRRGYPVEQAIKPVTTSESVLQFSEASWWEDWVGMPISDLHKIYWKWCVSHEYTPLQKQGFSRQVFSIYPNLKCVPTKHAGMCFRIIRERRSTDV